MNKRKIILLSLVFLLIGAGVGLYLYSQREPSEFKHLIHTGSYNPPQYPSSTGLPLTEFYVEMMCVPSTPDFLLDGQLSDRPPLPVMVYHIKNPEVTEQWVVDLARRLGILRADEEPSQIQHVTDSEIELYGSGGRVTVAVNSGGFAWFPDRGSFMVKSGGMIDETDAKLIATYFLKQHGLLPDNWVATNVEHTSAYGGAPPLDWGVSFAGTLNSLPIIGTKLVVVVSNNSDYENPVIKVVRYCREIERYQIFTNTRSPQQAYLDMIGRQGGDWYVCNDVERVVVKEVKIGYYIQEPFTAQDYVMPVYEFTGEQIHWDGEVEPFAGWCNVLY